MTDYATRFLNDIDTAQRVRLSDSFHSTPAAGFLTSAGVRPGGGALSLVASTMQFKLTQFVGEVPGVSSSQGPYRFVHDDATTQYTILDGDPLGSRIDLVCARVRDNTFDSSGFTDATIITVKGSPTTHLVSAVPAGCIPLWEVGVTATASAASGGVTIGIDRRIPAVATGGIAPLATNPATGLWVGQPVYNKTTGTLQLWDGSAWSLGDGDTGQIAIPFAAGWSGSGTYQVKSDICYLAGSATRASGSSTTVGTLPVHPAATASIMTRTANTSVTFGYTSAGVLAVGSAYTNADLLYFDNISFPVA